MSEHMPMYRHADEMAEAKPIVLPDSGLIVQPLRFSQEEEQWLAFLQQANILLMDELVKMFGMPPSLIGEVLHNR